MVEGCKRLLVADLRSALYFHKDTVAGILNNWAKNNRDENGIFYWKMLSVLNNYFERRDVQAKQNSISHL
jgi:hypothetical protein